MVEGFLISISLYITGFISFFGIGGVSIRAGNIMHRDGLGFTTKLKYTYMASN